MLRGCQKKIIILKSTGSPIFDEAYFILNDNAAASDRITQSDMVREANRIISENDGAVKPPRAGIWQMALWFCAGAVFAAAAAALIMLL